MVALVGTLPIHLAIQLISQANSTYDSTYGERSWSKLIHTFVSVMNDVLWSVVGTPLPEEPRPLPDGYIPFPDVGVAFKFFRQNLTWNAARKFCITEGGNLAVIDSFKKVDYGNQARNEFPLGPLIGIHKLYSDDEFVSSKTGKIRRGKSDSWFLIHDSYSGLPLPFIPWRAARDPSNKGKCGVLWAVGMDTTVCENPWVFMCEVPIFKPLLLQINIPGSGELATATTNPATLTIKAN